MYMYVQSSLYKIFVLNGHLTRRWHSERFIYTTIYYKLHFACMYFYYYLLLSFSPFRSYRSYNISIPTWPQQSSTQALSRIYIIYIQNICTSIIHTCIQVEWNHINEIMKYRTSICRHPISHMYYVYMDHSLRILSYKLKSYAYKSR